MPTIDDTDTPISWLARAGYASRGVVYLIIGGLGLLAAIDSGRPEGARGALESVLGQPFGHVLIGLMLVGLLGYVLWRLIQAITDTDDHGTSAKGLAVRAGLLASAATYATLAAYCASRIGLFSGDGDSSSGAVAEAIAAVIGMRAVSLGLALIFAGVGIAHCWKAVMAKFEDHFTASERTMQWLTPVSAIGLIARGIVFFILAFLLVYRGVTAGAEGGGTPGIEDALAFLHDLPMGAYLLAAMGAGILLFAVYSFCEAIWRRVRPDLF